MKTLYFDTAITGKWDFSGRREDAPRPHLVRVAMQMVEDDVTRGDPVVMIAYPERDWDFEEGAVDAHGISRARALRLGVSPILLVLAFVEHAEAADRLVAYAADFHIRMIRHAATECGWAAPIEAPNLVCAMRGARGLVPGAGSRLPKMVEAARHFKGEPMKRFLHDPVEDGAAVLDAVIAIDRGARAELGVGPEMVP